MKICQCLLIACLVAVNLVNCQEEPKFAGNIWAVLVAGSNGYYNYRHQADVCHAYQVLKAHGVPDDRIIVMMYDDIANDSSNPTPGVIINQPGGKDVYQGVPKDYVGREVTSKNFLKVLLGDKDLAAAGKKVLKSTPEDHVFVYFSDHGAPGLIAFPSDELVASDLIKTLNQMHAKNSYKRLVFYLEACESGSMFEDILDADKNIYAVTAANSQESSYACYWDDERGAFLGDEFSVAWIEESDKRLNLDSESVQAQYEYLVNATASSHVMQYGDLGVADLPLGHFQGEEIASPSPNVTLPRVNSRKKSSVPSDDAPIMAAKRMIKLAKDPFEKAQRLATYRAMVGARDFVKASVTSLAKRLQSLLPTPEDLMNEKKPITRRDCYEKLYKKYDKHCFDVSRHSYALRFLYVLVNVCESVPNASNEQVKQLADVIEAHCTRVDLRHFIYSSII